MCLDLIEKYVFDNFTNSILGTDSDKLNISGINAYQPFDGLYEVKLVWILKITRSKKLVLHCLKFLCLIDFVVELLII